MGKPVVVGKNGHGRPPKNLRKKKLRRLFRVKSYPNARDGLDINKPVNDMKRKHTAYRKSLSGVVVSIQKAFDGAKENNNRANKLKKDENNSLRSVQAAMAAVRGEQAKSAKIRRDKADNFPPLPK